MLDQGVTQKPLAASTGGSAIQHLSACSTSCRVVRVPFTCVRVRPVLTPPTTTSHHHGPPRAAAVRPALAPVRRRRRLLLLDAGREASNAAGNKWLQTAHWNAARRRGEPRATGGRRAAGAGADGQGSDDHRTPTGTSSGRWRRRSARQVAGAKGRHGGDSRGTKVNHRWTNEDKLSRQDTRRVRPGSSGNVS